MILPERDRARGWGGGVKCSDRGNEIKKGIEDEETERERERESERERDEGMKSMDRGNRIRKVWIQGMR